MVYIIDIAELLLTIVFLAIIGIIIFVEKVNDWQKNRKIKKDTKRKANNSIIAIKIMNVFEDLLSKYEIKISSAERENGEEKACIYGSNYYELEDSILEILNKNF